MSKKISNVALLTFEGAAFNVTFLALLLILVYPLTMVLKKQRCIKIYLYPISLKIKQYVIKIYFITNFDMLTYFKIAIGHASHLLLHKNMAL
jgi:hypothetical protein